MNKKLVLLLSLVATSGISAADDATTNLFSLKYLLEKDTIKGIVCQGLVLGVIFVAYQIHSSGGIFFSEKSRIEAFKARFQPGEYERLYHEGFRIAKRKNCLGIPFLILEKVYQRGIKPGERYNTNLGLFMGDRDNVEVNNTDQTIFLLDPWASETYEPGKGYRSTAHERFH